MPTNIPKNLVAKTNQPKLIAGGYGYARYGMALYGAFGMILNIQKSGNNFLWASSTFPWQEELPWQFTGSGLTFTNQSKS